ncbi:hypothetical protein BGZ76_007101 [Entomortierella beljakovae]|nr:hypothetical protein BGZ76_007101 [Entomortierella beljakovae]
MHPYIFFYLLGGITFIPGTLLVTAFILWLRLPYVDSSKPRATDLPPPHILQEQIEKDLINGYGALGSEKNSSLRMRKGVQSRSKSDQVFQSPTLTSSSVSSSASTVTTASAPAKLQSPNKSSEINSNSSDESETESENESLERNSPVESDKKTTGTRKPDVPMQSDPSLNREGYVRMTLVPKPGPAAESISDTLSNMLFQQKNSRPKDSYYAVLRYDTLFLYESDQQRDCKYVVPMTLYEVKISPQNLPDNEIFNKEHPIQVKRKSGVTAASTPANNGQNEYYIFIHSPVIKEDWYLALLYASKLRKPGTRQKIQDKAQFDLEALQNHIRILHSDRHHEQTRWFNSFIGRLFLGVYKTKKIQEVYIQKITKKTLKLKRPSFLGEIKVKSFNIGHSIPYITRTKLHDLTPTGELTSEFFLSYRGGVRVEIEVDVGLGLNTLKPVKVTIVLAVLVKSISGMMTLRVKAPPTNRFWIGFQEPPEMDIVIEPIVENKAIKLNMVISAIESKIREAMVEAIVLPNMDDYPFFNSFGTGGIFEGDEELSPDHLDESDAETMAENVGKSSVKAPGSKRRDSESSFSEHTPPPPTGRKQSWSSTSTESDVESESPLPSSSPAPGTYPNLHNNISSTTSTLSSSSFASKFKRFSQAHFSSKSADSAPEPTKLNTKPTVATSIATAIRTSPSSSPYTPASQGNNSLKLQSAIPKLSALNDAELNGPRIFASSSPSNGPSKKPSTSSLRRLASLESPESEDSTDNSGDESLSPPGNDQLFQPPVNPVDNSNSRSSHDGTKRTDFDTFPRSMGMKKWDSTTTADISKSFGNENRRTSLSKSSTHLGIAGILDPSSPPASGNSVSGTSVSQVQGNITTMFNTDKKAKKNQGHDENSSGSDQNSNADVVDKVDKVDKVDRVNGEQGSRSIRNEDSSASSKMESALEHGRKASLDGLLNLKMKKDMIMKKIASRNYEEDYDGTGGTSDTGSTKSSRLSMDAVGAFLSHRRRGSASSTKGPPQRPASAYEPMSQQLPQEVPQRKLVRSTSAVGNGVSLKGRRDVDLHPLGRPFATVDDRETKSSQDSSSSTGTSPNMSGLNRKSSFLHQKSQAALGSAKAWVKRSLEDRRPIEDDPSISGKAFGLGSE